MLLGVNVGVNIVVGVALSINCLCIFRMLLACLAGTKTVCFNLIKETNGLFSKRQMYVLQLTYLFCQALSWLPGFCALHCIFIIIIIICHIDLHGQS